MSFIPQFRNNSEESNIKENIYSNPEMSSFKLKNTKLIDTNSIYIITWASVKIANDSVKTDSILRVVYAFYRFFSNGDVKYYSANYIPTAKNIDSVAVVRDHAGKIDSVQMVRNIAGGHYRIRNKTIVIRFFNDFGFGYDKPQIGKVENGNLMIYKRDFPSTKHRIPKRFKKVEVF
jgi:hypothetical protein